MMATPIDPPNGMYYEGKHYFTMGQSLFEIDNNYLPISPIGCGAYGTVFAAYNLLTHEKLAIKKIHHVFENCVDALRTLRELKILRRLKHENVIGLRDVMLPNNRSNFQDVYLVYDLMDTDLHHIIKSPHPLSDEHVRYFLFQLLRGLKYLHSVNVLHRDLKPGNLLINANCDLKICDFGLARTKNDGEDQFMTEYVVTRWYRAPELLLCCAKYGTSIDVWSVGCILAEILGRKPLFPASDCVAQIRIIVNFLGNLKEADLSFVDNPKTKRFIMSLPPSPGIPLQQLFPTAHPWAIDLLEKMLIFDPTKRITVTEALKHPYTSNLYDPNTDLPAPVPLGFDMDDELDEKGIRDQMWMEILHYHPEVANTNANTSAGANTSAASAGASTSNGLF